MIRELIICKLNISTFNIMICLGMYFALLTLLYECKRQKLNSKTETKVITAFPFGFIFGSIVAHILDVYFHEGFYALFSYSIFRNGITFFGSLIGAISYLFIHAKIVKLKYLYLLNIYLPLFAIAQAFGRIGCFLGGCCYGKPCKFFGFSYPINSLPYLTYKDLSLFPIQLVESAYLFILFFIIMKFVKFNYRACIYLLLLSIGRFIFEFLRGDNRGTVFYDIISPSQFLSICLFIFGILLFVSSKRNLLVLN